MQMRTAINARTRRTGVLLGIASYPERPRSLGRELAQMGRIFVVWYGSSVPQNSLRSDILVVEFRAEWLVSFRRDPELGHLFDAGKEVGHRGARGTPEVPGEPTK